MHPALLFLPGERLTLPELTAARMDGDVVELGEGYIPADLVEGADARASAIAGLLDPGVAACGSTAAWIHGAGSEPPTVHHLRRAVAYRIRPHPSIRVVFHDRPLAESDVQMIGGVAVTTTLRTLADLAIGARRYGGFVVWAQRLATAFPGLASAAINDLRTRSRVPGKTAALILLENLQDQDEVTRYTS